MIIDTSEFDMLACKIIFYSVGVGMLMLFVPMIRCVSSYWILLQDLTFDRRDNKFKSTYSRLHVHHGETGNSLVAEGIE